MKRNKPINWPKNFFDFMGASKMNTVQAYENSI